MAEILVACAADKDHQGGLFRNLKAQMKRKEIEFLFQEIEPFSWNKLIRWELDVCEKNPNRPIVFVDAEDFFMMGSKQELEKLLAESSLLFHSESVCWPDRSKADRYPESPTVYRFVNGTGPAGNTDEIAKAIRYGLEHFPIVSESKDLFDDNDQRFYTDLYLAGFGKVDHYCRLSVQMNPVKIRQYDIVGKRILMYPEGTMPIFCHLNGVSKYNAQELLLRLL